VGEVVRRLEIALLGIKWEVVFVDDDSPDGTADELRALAQLDSRVRCVQRLGRRGLSRAVIEGILSTAAPVVAVMDADLQHDESALPRMLERLSQDDVDMVVATRYAAGGGHDGWDVGRVRMSRLATALTERIVPTGLTDPMSGFFVIRRSAFEPAMRRLSGEGYKLLLDIIASSPAPLRIEEVPYKFRPRSTGESKLDSAVALEFLLLLLDKRVGRWIPPRFILFSLVGASGVLVHFTALSLAFRGVRMAFGASQVFATFTAMTSNYALNNSLTYRDRRHRGLGWLRGLLGFYAICGIGVVGNVGVANALFARHGWILAAAAGALVGTVWNFAATRAVTWNK
jgi:dolichol-phosphate mannosyltransferase